MARLNLILLLIAVGCGLATVTANHRARKLFSALEKEQQQMRALDVEWGQLQLELSTWAAHGRIEKIAKERLQMKMPQPAQVIALEPAP
ncbi:MAG TPA: cell division protein FtsL [Rhodocyclaceae bacterium]|nr:cell division protein FtsL [Rhodocyclaceae bacterium]